MCKDVPSNVVCAGNPARVLQSLDTFQEKQRKALEIHPYYAKEYRFNPNRPFKDIHDEIEQELLVKKYGYGEV